MRNNVVCRSSFICVSNYDTLCILIIINYYEVYFNQISSLTSLDVEGRLKATVKKFTLQS